MDTLTHALSGALLACASAPATARPGALPQGTRVAAAFAAAAFPDVDFALRLAGTLTYLEWHQGPTHSLLLLPAWAWLLAHTFARLTRRHYPWRAFLAPAALGLGIHIAGDLLTAYGLMLWAPLSTRRFDLPLAFVIDPWLTAIVAAGLALALTRRSPRRTALLALAVLASYLLLLAALHVEAWRAGSAHARTNGWSEARVLALPQPLSAFHWTVIVRNGTDYHVAHVRLASTPPALAPGETLRRMRDVYRPVATARWERRPQFGGPDQSELARAAWQAPALTQFRRFAAFPAMDGVEHAGSGSCVWFVDLRFTFPTMPPSFRFGACRDTDAQPWRLRRQRGSWWID